MIRRARGVRPSNIALIAKRVQDAIDYLIIIRDGRYALATLDVRALQFGALYEQAGNCVLIFIFHSARMRRQADRGLDASR